MIDITQGATPESIYNEVMSKLQHGALCARIRLYEGYRETTMCVKEQRQINFGDDYHYVAIIGVARTGHQHGGIMFLAQDSLGQPFKNISLELLRTMNSTTDLQCIPHNCNVKMPNTSVFDMTPEDIATAGGLKLKDIEDPRCTDGPMSEEERMERMEKQELFQALVNPGYEAEWVRARRALMGAI